jgi:hypothetical protein
MCFFKKPLSKQEKIEYISYRMNAIRDIMLINIDKIPESWGEKQLCLWADIMTTYVDIAGDDEKLRKYNESVLRELKG